MTAYETVICVSLLALTLLFLWRSGTSVRAALRETEREARHILRKRGILLGAAAVLVLMPALFILFRNYWFLIGMIAVGFMAVGYAIGDGVGANLREH